MHVTYGADYSAGELSPQEVDEFKQHDIRFLGRYIGFPDNLKCISHFPGAYRRHVDAGRTVLLFMENDTDDFLGGHDRGVELAGVALRDANSIGYPDNLPIFFAADAHMAEQTVPTAMSYLDGAASVVGRRRTGAYGFREFVKAAKAGGHAQWLWLTGTAPSDEEVRQGLTHIYQSNQGQIKIAGLEADLDWAYPGVLDALRPIPIPKTLPVEPGGKFNPAVEAHLLHIWHEVHSNPEVSVAVKEEVATWKLYFRELDLWSSQHEIDAHHQHELTFGHRRLGVI
jgi:Rv2525c-like, glycoside hydrolase-like domain